MIQSDDLYLFLFNKNHLLHFESKRIRNLKSKELKRLSDNAPIMEVQSDTDDVSDLEGRISLKQINESRQHQSSSSNSEELQ